MNSPLLIARPLSSGPPIWCHRVDGTPATQVGVRHPFEAEGLLSSSRLQVN